MDLIKFQQKIENIAEKYADLVERRINAANELTGQDLRDIYDGIQMLGHITTTLEKASHMEKK